MSDISFFTSPGDTAFLLGLLFLVSLGALAVVMVCAALLRTMGSERRMVNDRFFGYFLGVLAAIGATLLILLAVAISDEGWLAHVADDWYGLWGVLCIAVGVMAGRWWNQRHRVQEISPLDQTAP
jgi:hypothetical protein